MKPQTRRRTGRVAGVAFLAATCLAAPPVSAQGPRGTGTLEVAPRSDRGDWNGTWYFVSRDFRLLMWMRTTNDRPQLKFQYQSLGMAEGFVTDWTGEVAYTVRRSPATFSMKIEEGDVNTASGSWNWDLDFGDSSRVERARFEFYRAGDGRALVLLFDDLVRVVRRGSEERRHEIARAWTFRKVSRRHVLWAEIYP